MNLKIIIGATVISASLLGCVGAVAQPESAPIATKAADEPAMTVEHLLDQMERVRKTVETFQADVAKTRRIELVDENEQFQGTLKFKSPRLLRLELENIAKGQKTYYIVGPEYGWIYREYKEQAERAKLSAETSEAEKGNPLEYGLTKDMHGLQQGFDLALLPEEEIDGKKTIPLQLTPEGGTTYSQGRIIFWIDPQNWLPVQVREYKSNDEIVETHTFTNIVLNKRVSDSNFEFKPPKDTDVILYDAQQ